MIDRVLFLLAASVLASGCATTGRIVSPTALDEPPKSPPHEIAPSPVQGAAARPDVNGHPLTSVVVTQCNLIVAVYMTMPDGRLMRFDKSARMPPEQLLDMAYSATRSERVEVDCNADSGAVGYEKHDPV